MLPEAARPPLFTLPDSTGRLVSLRDFLGEKRIAVVFHPPASYFGDVMAVHEQFDARELVVLVVEAATGGWGDKSSEKPFSVLTDRTGTTFRDYGAAAITPTFYLIGKDGTVKMARHVCPSNQELFGTIDAMPMRRREMRERGR